MKSTRWLRNKWHTEARPRSILNRANVKVRDPFDTDIHRFDHLDGILICPDAEPAQIGSRVEEASAEATFDKMVSPSLTDTSYAAEAVPFFRVVYVLVMIKQYFNQFVNPGGGVFEAYS